MAKKKAKKNGSEYTLLHLEALGGVDMRVAIEDGIRLAKLLRVRVLLRFHTKSVMLDRFVTKAQMPATIKSLVASLTEEE